MAKIALLSYSSNLPYVAVHLIVFSMLRKWCWWAQGKEHNVYMAAWPNDKTMRGPSLRNDFPCFPYKQWYVVACRHSKDQLSSYCFQSKSLPVIQYSTDSDEMNIVMECNWVRAVSKTKQKVKMWNGDVLVSWLLVNQTQQEVGPVSNSKKSLPHVNRGTKAVFASRDAGGFLLSLLDLSSWPLHEQF